MSDFIAQGLASAAFSALSKTLDGGGWQAIGTMGQNNSVPPARINTMAGNGAYEIYGVTYSQPECTAVSVSKIKIVHANYAANGAVTAPTASGESAAFCDLVLTGRTIDLVNGSGRKLKWGGKNANSLGQWGISVSDEISMPVQAGVFFNVQTCAYYPTSTAQGVAGKNYSTQGGVVIYANSGIYAADVTNGIAASPAITFAGGSAFYHNIVLGNTGVNPIKNFIVWGDSNQVSLGDAGCIQGGWCARVALGAAGSANLAITQANQGTPAYPFLNCSKQGESLVGFAVDQQHQMRLQFAKWFTNVICVLGTNDIAGGGSTLLQMQAAALKLAGLVSGIGKKFIMCTVPPALSGAAPNGGIYPPSAQTPGANESIRTGFNTWLRNTTSTGFVQQAIAAGCGSKYVDWFDAAAPVEVNSANVLTLNGGYFLTPASGATPLYSGTVTTGGSSNGFTDTSLGATANLYRGCVIAVTAGTNANRIAGIGGQYTTGVIGLNTGLTGNFAVGDTYTIWGAGSAPSAQDSVHLTAPAHLLIAAAFPISKLI